MRLAVTAVVTIFITIAMVSNLIPYLRGIPDQYQWQLITAQNPMMVIALIIAGIIVALCGWLYDSSSQKSLRIFAVVGFAASLYFLQLFGMWVRYSDVGLILAQRTLVPFHEDFFQAAQKVPDAETVLTDFESVRRNYGILRIDTHPPGMIYFYRLLIDHGPQDSTALTAFAKRLFEPEVHAKEMSPRELYALFIGTIVKMSSLFISLGALLLLFQLFPKEFKQIRGRLAAIFCLIPAVCLVTVNLDHMLMALTGLSLALFLHSLRPGMFWLTIPSALLIFFQSSLAYQAAVSGVIILISGGIYYAFWMHKNPPSKINWQPYLVKAGTIILLPAIGWFIVYLLTNYHFFSDFFIGISNHKEGPIHQLRNRWVWIPMNFVDLILFSGIALSAIWTQKSAWSDFWKNPFLAAASIALALIILQDGVRAETGRLFLFFIPILATGFFLGAGHWLESHRNYFVTAGLLIFQSACFSIWLMIF